MLIDSLRPAESHPHCEIRCGRLAWLHDGCYVDGVGPMTPEAAESALDWLDQKQRITREGAASAEVSTAGLISPCHDWRGR